MPDRSIEEIIQRAMQEGKFDNLAGKGLPLHLDQNPHEDPEWRAAYRVLKSGGFSLPWIESLQEITAKLQTARTGLARTWTWYKDEADQNIPSDQRKFEWDYACEKFIEQIAAINQTIRSHNLQVPNERFQLPVVDAEQEIERIKRSLY